MPNNNGKDNFNVLFGFILFLIGSIVGLIAAWIDVQLLLGKPIFVPLLLHGAL